MFLFLIIFAIYHMACSQTMDFGDAPDPMYPTLAKNKGAQHFIAPGILQGSRVDAENDGQQGMLSDGDDNSGGPDDEDGVVFLTNLVAGKTCSLQVVTPVGGCLNAWIDFLSNSQWTDAGDQIVTDLILTPGNNIILFNIPAVTSDDSGHAFTAHIATDYNWMSSPVSGLYVFRSVDGGSSWLGPVTVDLENTASGTVDTNYRLNDRCQIRADVYAGSTYHNDIYQAWIKDRSWNAANPCSDIYYSYSADGGHSFSKRTNCISFMQQILILPELMNLISFSYVWWMQV